MSKHQIEENGKSVHFKKFCSAPSKCDPMITEDISASKSNVISIGGEKFIDTQGGFLLEDKIQGNESQNTFQIEDISFEEFTCLECNKQYHLSFLMKHFDHPICDGCRDRDDKHALITRTDAKAQYLLKDCDFDKREPSLKFILKKNPHNVNWGQMKLYLHLQVEKRAIEVYGSLEKVEEAHEAREEKRVKAKVKKYNRNLKALRMEVRSSLFNRTSGPTHQHEFGPEKYNEDDDTYSRSCTSCNFIETFEKM